MINFQEIRKVPKQPVSIFHKLKQSKQPGQLDQLIQPTDPNDPDDPIKLTNLHKKIKGYTANKID